MEINSSRLSEKILGEKLQALKSESLLRELREPSGIDYCSNDYLGLAQNLELQKKICARLSDSHLGSGGSRLIRGHSGAVAQLEKKLAQFSGQDQALFFSSGYQANLALFSCLLKEKAVVFSDELNHASIIDGIKLSGCEKYIWGHNNTSELEMFLRQKAKPENLNIVVVESLYSMQGDKAPLKEISEICEKYQVELIVDEAHATGLFGKTGSGLVEELGLDDKVFAKIHTAGKSLGVSGAWITGKKILIDYLINRSRPFMYSTAPAFFQLDAVLTSLHFIEERGEELRKDFFVKLHQFQNQLKSLVEGRFPLLGQGGPVTSIVLGENDCSLKAMEDLRKQGIDIRAIRPPTVPKGEALLRITRPLNRTEQEDQKLLAALKEALS